MENRNYSTSHIIAFSLLLNLLLTNCFSSELKISQFEFRYNNQDYLVRSAYCSGNPESCNQLIGKEFVAVDMNQDRVIDKITRGAIALVEAQEIYDYCLNLLEKENKLSEVSRENNIFLLREADYDYEIKTFYPKGSDSFNEFTVTDKKEGSDYNKVSILIDYKADGTLDVLLKGGVLVEEAQAHYHRVIVKGLTTDKLKKEGDTIVVK